MEDLSLSNTSATDNTPGSQELPLDIALTLAIDVIGKKKNKFIKTFSRTFQYSDDPKMYFYKAVVNDKIINNSYSISSGLSFFSKDLAALKCLTEALERYSLTHYDKKNIILKKASDLAHPSLPIDIVSSLSKKQRLNNPLLKLNPHGKFGWVLGTDLLTSMNTYLPAQLTYISYKKRLSENIIRLPISTGAAAGTLSIAAICRGIFEIVERDAFIINYLNKIPATRVLLEHSKDIEIQKIYKIINEHKLEIYLFDITTDIPVSTFLAVLFDKSGVGPAISVGAKSHLNPREAILGAIQEVFTTRKWIRGETDSKYTSKSSKIDLKQRGILWSSLKNVKHINFLLNSANKVSPDIYKNVNYSWEEQYRKLLKIFTDMDYHVYGIEITPERVKHTPFCVYQVIIPELHPLYLQEEFPYLGGKRLYDVPVKQGFLKNANQENEFHKFPHPFL